jgi:RNA polymerase sigma-70 factor (ECF subfamily)
VFEDRWLVRRFNAGDPEVLRRIYEKYKPALFAVAGALLHEPAVVEDVVHDVFVGFASQAGRFELKGSLRGYLAICVANRARNIRRQDRAVAPGRRADSRPEQTAQPDGSETAARAEQYRLVRDALDRLPAEQHQVIVLHVFSALRFGAIARQTGESVNTVKSRYRYGIRKLQSLLNGQVEL